MSTRVATQLHVVHTDGHSASVCDDNNSVVMDSQDDRKLKSGECAKQDAEEESRSTADPAALVPSEEEEYRLQTASDALAEVLKHTDSSAPQSLRVLAPSIQVAVDEVVTEPNEQTPHPGFGIARGTLELVRVARKQWSQPQQLPLPAAPPTHAPITREFARPWSALRLRSHTPEPRSKAELSQDQALLKNYEPRFSIGEHTFPCEVTTPSFLDARVAVEDANAFLVTAHVRLALGSIEPLYCRVLLYDISLGCRATEEFCFTLPGAVDERGSVVARSSTLAPIANVVPQALFYALPNHLPQHLYLVLKITKVLVGDSESATAPYCSPERLASENEQQKLVEKAADCFRRLGRYRQPLAWGAIALLEGSSRPMTLYRQRASMSDEQRLPLIPEAVRGTLKERVIPSVCEFDLDRLDSQRLTDSKFQSVARGRSLPKNALAAAPILDILDPFSCARAAQGTASVSAVATPVARHDDNNSSENTSSATLPESEAAPAPANVAATTSDHTALLQCREVQPFCHPSVMSVFGLTGCGPVAVSYVNVMYLYPLHLEKFHFRNVAIRVQLLQREADFVCGIEDLETHSAVLRAVYAPNHAVVSAAYTLVNYHQKSPQFESEIKLCLPERLTLAHHVLFTFYHVHCKKLQSNQMQQELVGYAILPLLQKDGTILQDNNYVVNVFPTPIASKASSTGGVISLLPGYVAAARDMALDSSKTTLACRTRVLSSIHSQDRAVAAFLQHFHASAPPQDANRSPVDRASVASLPPAASIAVDDDVVVNKLLGLRLASTTTVRFFLFPIAKFVLGYLRFGSAVVRWAAFRAFLAVLEKASWTPHRSLKQDVNQILHSLVHIVFDEDAIEPPPGGCITTTAAAVASNVPESKCPQSIFRALLMEWLLVLQDNSPVEDNVETKRLSLAYSNMLLQLALKSIAIHTLRQRGARAQLPLALSRDDDELTERVLRELVYCIGNTANGLLLQKEVNRSIACCCRGLFLVVRNDVPARVIAQYMQWVAENQCDANVLVHILFPFLRIIVDFEFFAVVNGARVSSSLTARQTSASSCASSTLPARTGRSASPRRSSWLAKIVFERLLSVADAQREGKIRCDAVRLLRRMFVAQVYNPYHQSVEDQASIALIYCPFFESLAQFTADGKLLCSSGPSPAVTANGCDDAGSDKTHELKKELLICVVHLLSSVSTDHLVRFFQQIDDSDSDNASAQRQLLTQGNERSSATVVPLSPTGALMHYRKIVAETTHHQQRHSILRISAYEQKTQQSLLDAYRRKGGVGHDHCFDEIRVHACLALIRHAIETFLVDEPSSADGVLWQQLLSPDLVMREGRLSLLDIEMHLQHRRISRQRNSVSTDASSTAASGTSSLGRNSGTAIATSGLRSPNPKLVASGSNSALGPAAPVGTPRVGPNKSLPRNWGKSYAGGSSSQRRTSGGLSLDGKSMSTTNISASVSTTGAGGTATVSTPSGACSLSQTGDGDDTDDYEPQIRNLHRITAVTALRSLRTAVDQFEWVIRLIEVPLDCNRQPDASSSTTSGITEDQAFALLGTVIDLLFLLMRRANAIETLYRDVDGAIEEDDGEDDADSDGEDQCFLTDLFAYLEVFVVRFRKALFACRIADLPLVHDECRVQLLLSITATGKTLVVRQHAARLLCKLFALCYEQTGSFLLVKGPLFQVLCSVFFARASALPPVAIPTESLRDAVEEMRQQQSALADEAAAAAAPPPAVFAIQFQELLNGLVTQIKVFEMWHAAVTHPEQLCDVEEVEDGLYRIMRAISPHWLLDEKTHWLNALLQLHVSRRQFAQAACCKLEAIAFTQQVVQSDADRSAFALWHVRELVLAREFAERAEWLEQQVAISEQLLACLKQQRRFPEYLETLRYLERIVCQLAESEAQQSSSSGSAFYRVAFAGDCVSPHVAKREFIYRRSKFVSLGEFVNELKATLRVKYPMCERIDVVPESKALAGDDQPNVVFLRVTSVECVQPMVATPIGSPGDSVVLPPTAVFSFAMPFTRSTTGTGGTTAAYGKTSEQMKRITFLSAAQPFPCAVTRQVVVARREELRCPIENAMDDIRKRCALLQLEIRKEALGRTDLKTLTLVLKGSVDTHVHGGVPEVIESFLATLVAPSECASCGVGIEDTAIGASGNDAVLLPPLLDARGSVMSVSESTRHRHALANLLVDFIELCWQALLISRDAYRRAARALVASSPPQLPPAPSVAAANGSSSSVLPLLLSPEAVSNAVARELGTASTSFASILCAAKPQPGSTTLAPLVQSAAAGALDDSDDDPTALSPLQLEFEKSFAALVALVHRKIPFVYDRAGDVPQLLQLMQLKRMGVAAGATPSGP